MSAEDYERELDDMHASYEAMDQMELDQRIDEINVAEMLRFVHGDKATFNGTSVRVQGNPYLNGNDVVVAVMAADDSENGTVVFVRDLR